MLRLPALAETHALYRQQTELLGARASRLEFPVPEHNGEVAGAGNPNSLPRSCIARRRLLMFCGPQSTASSWQL